MKLSLFYGAAALVFANGVVADDNKNSIVSNKKISRRKLLERTTRKTKHSGKGGKGKGGKKCKQDGEIAILEDIRDLGGACPLWDECDFQGQTRVSCEYCDLDGTGEFVEFDSDGFAAVAQYDIDSGFVGIFSFGTGAQLPVSVDEAITCGQIVYDACLAYLGETGIVDVCDGEEVRRNLGDEQDSSAKNFKENVGVPKNKVFGEGKDRRLTFGGNQGSSPKNSGAPKDIRGKNFLVFTEGEDQWTCQKQGI